MKIVDRQMVDIVQKTRNNLPMPDERGHFTLEFAEISV